MKTKQAYKAYAGIGARNTPDDVLDTMFELAEDLEQLGYILRTGGAEGADTAFYQGVQNPKNAEVYLPWQGYNNYRTNKQIIIPKQAYDLARMHHPNWDACKPAVQKLHARNNQIILGANLENPVDFVICYTPNGSATGGTGQAIRVADAELIHVFDLGIGIDITLNNIERFINGK
jgi:hypothetical protein